MSQGVSILRAVNPREVVGMEKDIETCHPAHQHQGRWTFYSVYLLEHACALFVRFELLCHIIMLPSAHWVCLCLFIYVATSRSDLFKQIAPGFMGPPEDGNFNWPKNQYRKSFTQNTLHAAGCRHVNW